MVFSEYRRKFVYCEECSMHGYLFVKVIIIAFAIFAAAAFVVIIVIVVIMFNYYTHFFNEIKKGF